MEQANSKKTKKHLNKDNQKSAKRGQKEDKKNKKPNGSQASNNGKTSRSSRNRKRDRFKREKESNGVKLVLRLLPPGLTEEQFTQTLIANTGKFSDFNVVEWYYVQGSYPLKLFSEPTHSRCYFLFGAMDQLKEFSAKAEQVKFTDDRNNSSSPTSRVSLYPRMVIKETKANKRNSKDIEGKIQKDPLFKTFVDSLKLLEEHGSEYGLENVSILKPMKKELAKKRSIESEIKSRSELAMIELTGHKKNRKSKGDKESKQDKNNNDKEGKKKKKKSKKGTAMDGLPESNSVDEKKTRRKRSKKKKKAAKEGIDSQPQENVVILEAAGKKELQRRKNQQDAKTKSKKESSRIEGLESLLQPKKRF
ncbi:hypothetical protein HG535_0C02980 [Zygotorulaspora mrakii]|uniref:UPF3 domain-containing protein n=1 Tax=Zygotorulaspora mrakii TaxID=42260 RepID=A0A7H9B0C8_ZYGMR|nr:uncharacterized protein HG535_0C02980 [Zygotorulaspora mrakii]QLG71946.1 hypothetical protein HG535_0C02980 [Zygotorulaspora mrakii]